MSGPIKKGKSKQQQFDYLQKVIIIGDSGVGKSNVLLRYSEGKFVQNYMMTIGINYMYKVALVDGVKIKLQIWDTAGQDKYKTITQNYYRNSDGVLIVFSINDRESFQSVRNWIQDLSQTIKNTTQVILVGNKLDLQQQRQVSKEQADHFAKNHKIPFIECSAKSGESVQFVFDSLARMMKQKILDPKINQQQLQEKEEKSGVIKHLQNFRRRVNTRCCQN